MFPELFDLLLTQVNLFVCLFVLLQVASNMLLS